jgi:hypothetical protein
VRSWFVLSICVVYFSRSRQGAAADSRWSRRTSALADGAHGPPDLYNTISSTRCGCMIPETWYDTRFILLNKFIFYSGTNPHR